jgi:hypothetical protein
MKADDVGGSQSFLSPSMFDVERRVFGVRINELRIGQLLRWRRHGVD